MGVSECEWVSVSVGKCQLFSCCNVLRHYVPDHLDTVFTFPRGIQSQRHRKKEGNKLPNSRFPQTSQSNKRYLDGSIFGVLCVVCLYQTRKDKTRPKKIWLGVFQKSREKTCFMKKEEEKRRIIIIKKIFRIFFLEFFFFLYSIFSWTFFRIL